MALQDIPVVQAIPVDGPEDDTLARWRSRFPRLHLDLGCGDARFAHRKALGEPDHAVVGIDTCLDNIRLPRKAMPPNLRLIKADARSIRALTALGGADRITINFPYGSLLRWIVDDGEECLGALTTSMAPGATLEIRINASARREIGIAPGEVERRLWDAFDQRGEWRARFRAMDQATLRAFPTSWARRIGSGRPTTALEITAHRIG